MSSTDPITPARFAAALHDLPLSSLALKVAELRNSIAHLDYSNEQLKPFAHPGGGAEGDRDCAEAIVENEEVIRRMEERIGLVKEEVERRGASWREVGFMVSGSREEEGEGKVNGLLGEGDVGMANGGVGEGEHGGETVVNGHGDARGLGADGEAGAGRHSAWTDGTFQTGTIGGGAVTMDRDVGQGQRREGGTLGDEELRRRLEERTRANDADEDGGMHL
jgi:hypothetical protein